jgi:hypothetical protein
VIELLHGRHRLRIDRLKGRLRHRAARAWRLREPGLAAR